MYVEGEGKMGSAIGFQSLEEEQIKVIIDFIEVKDSCLHLKLNPKEYFYPYISVRPDDIYFSYTYDEDGFSLKAFQWEKKKIKMLGDERYKKIFQKKLVSSLFNYLRAVEGEAEFEFNQGESLEQKVAQKEQVIYDLIKTKGPGIFRYAAILEKIGEWCDEKETQKIDKIAPALKGYGKIICGKIPFSSFEERYYFLQKYPTILKNIRLLKKDITFLRKKTKNEKTLKKEIVEKWAEESKKLSLKNHPWFELLVSLAAKDEAKCGTSFITFIKETSPRELAIRIFSELIFLGEDTIDKLLRNREDILKTMSMTSDSMGHGFWWNLALELEQNEEALRTP